MRRERNARALLRALLACDPDDRVPLLELFLDTLRCGQPTPLIGTIMAEASFWADWASRNELKAYALASYTRLSEADKRAFVAHVTGGRNV